MTSGLPLCPRTSNRPRTRNGVCRSAKERSRGPLSDPYGPARQCGQADRRSRDRGPSAVELPLQAPAARWRIGEPRRRSSGHDLSGRRANRQDHQRDPPSRHSGRRADALRALHQLEDRPFAEPDYPAIAARGCRQDHRMRRRRFVTAAWRSSVMAICRACTAPRAHAPHRCADRFP